MVTASNNKCFSSLKKYLFYILFLTSFFYEKISMKLLNDPPISSFSLCLVSPIQFQSNRYESNPQSLKNIFGLVDIWTNTTSSFRNMTYVFLVKARAKAKAKKNLPSLYQREKNVEKYKRAFFSLYLHFTSLWHSKNSHFLFFVWFYQIFCLAFVTSIYSCFWFESHELSLPLSRFHTLFNYLNLNYILDPGEEKIVSELRQKKLLDILCYFSIIYGCKAAKENEEWIVSPVRCDSFIILNFWGKVFFWLLFNKCILIYEYKHKTNIIFHHIFWWSTPERGLDVGGWEENIFAVDMAF